MIVKLNGLQKFLTNMK